MKKEKTKKILGRLAKIGTGFVVFAGTLVGGYLLTPNKVKRVDLSYNEDADVVEDNYLTKFINHVKNAADTNSEEEISGLKASFQNFEITWGYENQIAKNDITLSGDFMMKMASLSDLDFTLDLDVNYNSKHLDFAVGFVDRSMYLAIKDLKLKSTVTSEIDNTDQIFERLNWLFFNDENPDGLGITVDLEGIIGGLISGMDFSKLTGGMAFEIIPHDEEKVGTDVIDYLDLRLTKAATETETEKVCNINLRFVFDAETGMPKLIDLGTIDLFGKAVIKGAIACEVVDGSLIVGLDDENYLGKKRTGFTEMIDYIGWADKLLNFLQTRKAGLELDTTISLINEKTHLPEKLTSLHGDIDFDLSQLFDLAGLAFGTSNESEEPVEDNSEENDDGLIAQLLRKVSFGINLTAKGNTDIEHANLGVHYKNNMGYLTLNEDENTGNAVMRAKVSTDTISEILAKVPDMVNAIVGEEAEEEASSLFDFVTGSELVTAIKDGRYDGILDLLTRLESGNKTITIGLNLSSLGFGDNAAATLVLDANDDPDTKVLDLELENIELGETAFIDSLSLKSKDFDDTKINYVVNNSSNFDELNYLPTVFDQVSEILESKKAGFTVSGQVYDKNTNALNLDIDGWGQFDYGTKYGYGRVDLDQYKNGSLYYEHVIKLDVDNKGDVLANKNVKFTYGAHDGIKGNFTIQTIKDIYDLISRFIDTASEEDKFMKFVDPLLDTLGISYIGNVIDSKDYLKFASSEVVKEIKDHGSYVSIVINGEIMSLTQDLEIRINFIGEGELRKIHSLEVPSLVVNESRISGLKVTIVDFNENLESPVNKNYTFMDFSDISLLLDFGINTTEQNVYELTANINLKILGIFNAPIKISAWVEVTGASTRVYGIIKDVPLTGLTTTVNSEFIFEPDHNASGNDVGGYFHILREEIHSGLFNRKTEYYYYRSTSKNFIDTDNILDYLLVDMLSLSESTVHTLIDNNGGTGDKESPEYEYMLDSFESGSNYWKLGLDLKALTGVSMLSDLDLTINSKTVNGKNVLDSLDISTSILSFVITVSGKITLDNAGSTAEAWASNSTPEKRYNFIKGIYEGFSTSMRNTFDTGYMNKPLKHFKGVLNKSTNVIEWNK